MKRVIEKTNGKKTTASAIAYLLYEAIKLYKPDLFSPGADHLIMIAINTGLITGIIHKGIRHRKEIKGFLKRIFTKKK